MFHPTNILHLLIEIRYPLSFVIQTDTLDLLVSIGYALSFVNKDRFIECFNRPILLKKKTCVRFNFLTDV